MKQFIGEKRCLHCGIMFLIISDDYDAYYVQDLLDCAALLNHIFMAHPERTLCQTQSR
jgi:hypothetical protein